jgi:uncharacterized membrane protein
MPMMGWGGWIIMLIFLGLGDRRRRCASHAADFPPEPLGAAGEEPAPILKERYARWEIDREKFEQMKRDLE